MTIPSIKSNVFISAVLAGLPAIALLGISTVARAQYQTGGNGHLLDANNRIGSGGYNGNGTSHENYNVNNNVVTGNVSGLNYFHDNRTTEFDANTFQGNTGSSSFEGFNAAAAPVDYGKRTTGTPNYVPYYNTGNTVGQLPSNYTQTPGATGYIPAPTVSPLTPQGYDTRMELTNVDLTKGNLLPPDEMSVAGPIDPSSGTQSMYSMSPLYGVRQNDGTTGANTGDGTAGAAGSQETVFNSRTTNARSKDPSARTTLDPAAIQRMRDELNTTVVPNDESAKANITTPNLTGAANGTAAANGSTTGSPDATPNGQLNPTVTGANDQLNNQALASGAITNPQLNGNLNSGESVQNNLIVPPAKQSKQLEEMEKRYAAKNVKLDDVGATKKFNEEVRLQKIAADKADASSANTKTPKPNYIGSGATGTGTGLGSTGTTADKIPVPTPTAKPILTRPQPSEESQPYIVTSLATGITAKGLSQLMKSAEDQMRQGKFTEAVDTYETAEQVAPNNPFVSLGRGFAELGANYYGKADKDISSAITADPAILVGRYDLKGFLGEDRLSFVHKDLQDVADHEKGARPLVLLGYIAHNTGDDASTARDLDEAAQRGGYNDLIKLMKQAWSIK